MQRPGIPIELAERIIDALDGDRRSLESCVLVHKSWVPRCRAYLHNHIVVNVCHPGHLGRLRSRYSISPFRDLVHYISIKYDGPDSLNTFSNTIPPLLLHFPKEAIYGIHCHAFDRSSYPAALPLCPTVLLPSLTVLPPICPSLSPSLEGLSLDLEVSLGTAISFNAFELRRFLTCASNITSLSISGTIEIDTSGLGGQQFAQTIREMALNLRRLSTWLRWEDGDELQDKLLLLMSTADSPSALTSLDIAGSGCHSYNQQVMLDKCGKSLTELAINDSYSNDSPYALWPVSNNQPWLRLQENTRLRRFHGGTGVGWNMGWIHRTLLSAPLPCLEEVVLSFKVSGQDDFTKWYSDWASLDRHLVAASPNLRRFELRIIAIHIVDEYTYEPLRSSQSLVHPVIEHTIRSALPNLTKRSLLHIRFDPFCFRYDLPGPGAFSSYYRLR